MTENKIVVRCTKTSAVLLVMTSLIHAFNINDVLVGLKTGDIAPAYAPAIVSVWIFASICMCALAGWLLFLSSELRKYSRKAWWQALVIGLSLAGFGLGCWLQYPKAFYLLYFFILGMITTLPLLRYAKHYNI